MVRTTRILAIIIILAAAAAQSTGCAARPPAPPHPKVVKYTHNRTRQPFDRPVDIFKGRKFDTRSVEAICAGKGITFSDPRIVIDKSTYVLTLFSGNVPVKDYSIVLGHSPVDDKQMEGDKRTPEGEYHVRAKYPHSQWSYFLWLDYPNRQDEVEFEKLKSAGVIPGDAKIGGEIGIHGAVYDDWQVAGFNWTSGCISLSSSDITELYEHVKAGTPVTITKTRANGGARNTATPRLDVVALAASAWQGVDIYDNKKPHSEPTNYRFGQKWQCVELVQRFYATKWGYPPVWPVSSAYQMWDAAPTGIQKHANGDMSCTPLWGDVIVFGQHEGKGYGHVAIVVGVKAGRVYVVQQNSGRAREVL
ncbi:MAG: L,D-transpeptidase family protein, partial [Candidatus Geothermincolia bacterium]